MSLFRPYNYKPKADLPANAPVKHGFFLFFELYFRKFWRFVTLNLYYFVITLPILLVVYYAINSYFLDVLIDETGEFHDILGGIGIFASMVTYIPPVLQKILLAISVILYGPVTMGITYIFRNFAREEHAWTSDLVSRGLSNFRQGVFFGILDLLVTYLLFTGATATIFSGVMSLIFKALCVLALVVYYFMRHYFYMIAVSVNLSCFAILKNSWLFVVLGFWRNLWSAFVCLVTAAVCFFIIPIVTFITVPFIFYSFTGFCVVFTCYPVVKKYLIVPAMELEAQKKAEASVSEAQTENDMPAGEQ